MQWLSNWHNMPVLVVNDIEIYIKNLEIHYMPPPWRYLNSPLPHTTSGTHYPSSEWPPPWPLGHLGKTIILLLMTNRTERAGRSLNGRLRHMRKTVEWRNHTHTVLFCWPHIAKKEIVEISTPPWTYLVVSEQFKTENRKWLSWGFLISTLLLFDGFLIHWQQV